MTGLDSLFDYKEGFLYWKVSLSNRTKVGSRAGCRRKDGYYVVRVRGELLLCHRIIWSMCNKKDIPEGYVIDHIDENPSNNLIDNLRCIPKMQNSWRLPAKGYYVDKRSGKYVATIRAANKRISLGQYDNPEEASKVYQLAKTKHHIIKKGTQE